MADLPRSAPNVHVVRATLYRGVGAARSRGAVGFEVLFVAALAALDGWAAERPGYRYDRDAARAALLLVSGGPDAPIWTHPNPEPEALPHGLEALVAYAVEKYGTTTMWYANRTHIVADPCTSWRPVAEMLCNNGGPDPRPFWVADAIEAAAVAEGAVDADT